VLILAVTLAITPWKGPALPAATPNAAQYLLWVRGDAHREVHLRASGLPKGWIASFCSRKVCSPFQYTLQLDANGRGEVEFQAVRVDESAPRTVRVTVSPEDGSPIGVTVTAK
jgi:hypothetical protein